MAGSSLPFPAVGSRPPGLVFPGLFPQGSCGNGHHRRFPFFPSWRTSASFWMKTASSVRVLGEGLGGAEPQPGWRPQEPERSAAIVSSEGPGLLRQQSPAQTTWCCCKGTASLRSGFSASLSQFFALSSNSGLMEGRGPRPRLQRPHLTKCQKHQLGATRGGSLEGRRQESSLPLVPAGRLH